MQETIRVHVCEYPDRANLVMRYKDRFMNPKKKYRVKGFRLGRIAKESAVRKVG